MKILLIEDNEHKSNQIKNYVLSEYDCEIVLRKSYNSGLIEVFEEKYDLILLDMSLPNYDISGGGTTEDFEPNAGKYILNEMYRNEIESNVIIITFYQDFIDKNDLELRSEFDNYLGAVHFSTSETSWKEELNKLIEEKYD